jgi:deoxyribonuclease V
MEIAELHPWDVTPDEARALQARLRERLRLDLDLDLATVRLVAGADAGYAGRGADTQAWAAVVVLTFPDLEIVETQVASRPVTFPYVPGLLSFREGPVLIDAFRHVQHAPDAVLFDGQGIAHPRRLGLASHIGLWLDLPALGCAKSRLTGTYTEPDDAFAARTPLVADAEVRGAAVRTRLGRSPLFVSPGHRCTVESAVELALACCRQNRFMPEPTRLADALVRDAKRAALASAVQEEPDSDGHQRWRRNDRGG